MWSWNVVAKQAQSGAIQFIENLDRTVLTISDGEFERNVETAVSAIAEREQERSSASQPTSPTQFNEKLSQNNKELVTENVRNTEMSQSSSRKEPSDSTTGSEERAAVGGLLRTIQRPLSSIGRIFSEDLVSPQFPGIKSTQVSSLPPETPRRLSPAVFQPPRNSQEGGRPSEDSRPVRTPGLSAEDAAARQASAEAAEAQRIQRAEHKDVVEYAK